MAEVSLAAVVRRVQGSSDSRRLRASGKIPGIIYGHGTEPIPVAVVAREVRLALNTPAGLNALIQLDVEGTQHLALPRDIQRHPVRNTVSHIDFQVVRRDEMMEVEIPIHLIGEAEAVSKQGGVVEQVLQTLTVQSTPTNIPSSLSIDITNLTFEESIRVADIVLPEGVTTALDPEEAVVTGKLVYEEPETAVAAVPAEGEVGGAEAPPASEG